MKINILRNYFIDKAIEKSKRNDFESARKYMKLSLAFAGRKARKTIKKHVDEVNQKIKRTRFTNEYEEARMGIGA